MLPWQGLFSPLFPVIGFISVILSHYAFFQIAFLVSTSSLFIHFCPLHPNYSTLTQGFSLLLITLKINICFVFLNANVVVLYV